MIIRDPHICDLPYATTNGTIWRCDECGKLYRFRNPGNINYAAWWRAGPITWWKARRYERVN